jgi:hypothetical protein
MQTRQEKLEKLLEILLSTADKISAGDVLSDVEYLDFKKSTISETGHLLNRFIWKTIRDSGFEGKDLIKQTERSQDEEAK